LIAAGDAEAALLTNVEGAVFVNRGDGFKPVFGAVPIVAGDRVRAAAGSAVVVYDNGCSQKVGPNQTVLVYFASPCVSDGGLRDGTSASDPSAAAALLAGGVGLAVGLATSQPSVSP
jgi:hypothetical protein